MNSSLINGLVNDSFNVLKTQAEELYLRDFVTEVEGSPTPLEFIRDWVSQNIPVVFRGAGYHIPAVKKWTPKFLMNQLGEKMVTVAVTPNGFADAVSEDGQYFMLPEERQMKFCDFIEQLEMNSGCDSPVLYMQQQNSNLTGEMRELIGDVPIEIDWATEAFDVNPDAVNFWMGDSRAVTSTHKDPYENLYCVIRGEKTFVLTPPTDLPGMVYKSLPVARYSEVQNKNCYQIVPVENSDPVSWICSVGSDKMPITPKSVNVCVKAGDILYLPSLWFHQVSQSHGCIAVNYWYDMRFDIKFAYFSMLEHLCSKS
ncbi:hypothetical protein B566_EDAN006023 [Ephemera danica]|nr:hypothetical protein B566_EDAN006023 [Ephemera danica]